MRISAIAAVLTFVLAGSIFHSAQAEDKMVYAGKASSKFVNFPGLPKCAMGSVQNGDPSKGASVILTKTSAGCLIPWHWHTAAEQLMVIAGAGKVSMKEGSPVSLHPGDYVFLPGKNVHQFNCVAACTFFIVPDGAFDIHYVDASGKEIPPDQALKSTAKAKSAAKKSSTMK